jgi:hypothetical protein
MTRKTGGQAGLSQRQKSWILLIIATGIVVSLLYWEQIALLYVLATLSVTALLVVVAVSDLHGGNEGRAVMAAGNEPLPIDSVVGDVRPVSQSTFGTRKRKGRR